MDCSSEDEDGYLSVDDDVPEPDIETLMEQIMENYEF